MRERTTDMEKYIETHHLIALAEKLLYYKHIVGCFEVCNEAERMASQMNDESKDCPNGDYYLTKIKSIRRRLNGLMALEVRQSQRVFLNPARRSHALANGMAKIC